MHPVLRRAIYPIRRMAARFVDVGPLHVEPRPRYYKAGDHDSIIRKCASMVADEKIEGDYLEFGVFTGYSFIRAYHTLHEVFVERQTPDEYNTHEGDMRKVAKMAQCMRFFAFDSFEGLPELQEIDKETRNFAPGKYACGEEAFLNNLTQADVPLDNVMTVPGWFEDSCKPETLRKYGMKAAAIINIDCDLYSSTLTVLNFITPLLQDGTILIFDDWYCYRGDPELGEQRAFKEWQSNLTGWFFTEYQKEGPNRNSFIAHAR